MTGEESGAQGGRCEPPVYECSGVNDVDVLATTGARTNRGCHGEGTPRRNGRGFDPNHALRQLESSAGTVSQLREVTARLVDNAKAHGVGVFLIGHVTKEGAIAGPQGAGAPG